MKLEKVKFLLKLIKDEDVKEDLNDSDIFDFEIIDDKTIVILKKYNKETNEKEYIRFIITSKKNIIGITKSNEEGYNVFYGLDFGKALNNYYVNVLYNFKPIMTYQLSDNFLTCNNVEDIKILAKKGLDKYANPNDRIIGKKR